MPTLRTQRILIAALLLATTLASAQQPTTLRPIQIENGKLLGVLTADQKVVAYKGIPYAQPPVEELRWRPPQPVGKWKKVLFARDFGSHCLQSGAYPDMVFHDPGPSEDCLTLNVWAPFEAKPERKSPSLPVMVWIYGGGFNTGGTSENRQDGEFLAHRGVIVVSMNYRLGIFGFFAHPELTAESSNHTSGNYGLMDQAAAIAWVRRNIAAFGGDPANITVFGQSAGSMSVSALMASPIPNGLFTKAIGESGSEFPATAAPSNPRSRQSRSTPPGPNAPSAPANSSTSANSPPTNCWSRNGPHQPRAPLRPHHRRLLPARHHRPHLCRRQAGAHPPARRMERQRAAAPRRHHRRQLHRPGPHPTSAPTHSNSSPSIPPPPTPKPSTPPDDFAGDQFIAFCTWEWLEAQTKTGNAPVYRYFFTSPSPGDRNHPASQGAFHSDDIEYVFGTLDSRAGMHSSPRRPRSSPTSCSSTGPTSPNTATRTEPQRHLRQPALPQWPIYTPATNYQVMHLDATPAAQPDTLRPRYLFLEQFWSKQQ